MPITTPQPPDITPYSLRAKRLAAGITQEHLAGLAGVSLAFVGNLERGYVPKRSDALPRILEVLARFEEDQKSEGSATTTEPLATTAPANGARDHGSG